MAERVRFNVSVGMAAVALLATMLAGCVADPPAVTPTQPADPVDTAALSSIPTLVHAADGTVLDVSAFSGELPDLVQSRVADRYSWEPSIGVGPDGSAYYRSSGAISEPPRGYLYRSDDLGETWVDVSPRLAGVVPLPVFTGDPFVHVDSDTGRIFYYDQQAYLTCDHWAISDDRGTSWETWDTCQEDGSYGDHPTITTGPPQASKPSGYPNVVYFCASIGGESSCRVSMDGGRTYAPPVTTIESCTGEDGQQGPSQHGHVRTAANGSVFVAKVACGAAWVGISHDDGTTWRTVRINESGWTRPNWPEYNEHEASVAADSAGNIYVTVVGDDGLVKLVVSQDDGVTWSRPMTVSRPEVTAANFAHIVAGDSGAVAILYVGTTVEGGYEASSEVIADAPWNAYVAITLNGAGENPVFATDAVNPLNDPIRRGPCDGRCPVREGPAGRGILQPGMYDFLDIDISPVDGRVWVALVDLCHDACAAGPGSGEEGAYAVASAGVQRSGHGLLIGR